MPEQPNSALEWTRAETACFIRTFVDADHSAPKCSEERNITDQKQSQELPSNIGKTVEVVFPDGSRMQWEVVDEIRKNEDAEKIFVLQRLRQKADVKQEIFRFGYYIIGKKPKMKDKWTWGQYAPFVSAEDFQEIIKEAQRREWIK